MCKINLSTPADEMIKNLQAERKKAIYWFNKSVGGNKGEAKKKDELFENLASDTEHKPIIFPPVLFESPSKNKWLTFYVAVYVTGRYARWFPMSFCYYETEGSVGCYDCYKEIVVIYTSHFFQRLCERTDIKADGVNTITEFFRRTVSISFHSKERKPSTYTNKEGQPSFYAICSEGLIAGIIREDGKIWEVRTFISKSMMRPVQINMTEPLQEAYDEFKYLVGQPADKIEEYKEPIKKKQENPMEKDMREGLIKVLRDSGITNFSSIVLAATSMDKDKYLIQAETEYVLSRLLPFCNLDRDRERMIKACKLWLTMVVEKGWSENLKPYIDKYGKYATSKAIDDLVDNNLWGGPNGKDSLKNRGVGHYADLDGITEEIPALIEKGVISQDDLPNAETEEVEPKEEAIPVESLQSVNEVRVVTSEEAVASVVKAANLLTQLEQEFYKVRDFATANPDGDKNLKEIDRLVRQRDNLEKTLQQKNEKIDKLNQDYQAAQDRYTSKSKEYDELCKRNATLKNDYYSMTERCAKVETERDELKKKAQEAAVLPRKRVIPLSKFMELPLVGPKAIKVIGAFLAKYDIIIDENK